jgi:hypothetical protein
VNTPSLYPDRRPGHQADQAQRLAVADIKLQRHLTAYTDPEDQP